MSIFEHIENKNMQQLVKCVESGQDINQKHQIYECTPLHRCCTFEWAQGMQYLLSKGADPEIKNFRQKTPLYECCISKWKTGMQILLEHGVNTEACDYDGNTPLIECSDEDGYPDGVKMLLSYNANVLNENYWRWNAIKKTIIFNKSKKIFDLLLDRVDNIDDKKEGFTLLHLCCERKFGEGIRSLLSRSASTSIRNRYNDTALQDCFYHRYKEGAKLLIENGADLSLKDSDGNSLGQIAIDQNHKHMLDLLEKRKRIKGVEKSVKKNQSKRVLNLRNKTVVLH